MPLPTTMGVASDNRTTRSSIAGYRTSGVARSAVPARSATSTVCGRLNDSSTARRTPNRTTPSRRRWRARTQIGRGRRLGTAPATA